MHVLVSCDERQIERHKTLQILDCCCPLFSHRKWLATCSLGLPVANLVVEEQLVKVNHGVESWWLVSFFETVGEVFNYVDNIQVDTVLSLR